MRPTRNNRGKSHENGAIESSHGHFKRRLHQALLLRGSTDFENVFSYQQLIDQVVASLNHRSSDKFMIELAHLQKLPTYPVADYEIKSLLITCNQPFSDWDSIFADATMTVAAVARLVHHATIIQIQQESFRQKQALNRKHSP